MGEATLAARGRLGHTIRNHADDPEKITQARRDLAAAKLEDYIRRTVDAAPPLTDAQRSRLAELLRPHRAAVLAATDAAGGGRDAT